MSVPATTAAADAKHRLNESALNLLRLASIRNHDIWPALNAHIRLRAFRRVATVLLALVALVAFVAYVPTLNWTAAALGRMGLIRGVLPFWDWRHLDDDLCLWRKHSAAAYQAQSDVGDDVTDWDQEQSCVYCEQIDHIKPLFPPISATDFEHYVRFNQPILVLPSFINSSSGSNAHWTPATILAHLLNADHKLDAQSATCDVYSNVQLGDVPTLNQIVEHTLQPALLAAAAATLATRDDDDDDEHHQNITETLPIHHRWHVAFRNCAPGSTKASRPLWPRPAWIPMHLRPYRFSWMLLSISNNDDYDSEALEADQSRNINTQKTSKHLRVRGLAAMTQLCGQRWVQLSPLPMGRCLREDITACRVLRWQLRAGETMVFDAKRWRLNYAVNNNIESNNDGDDDVESQSSWLSATFVAEFDWLY